MDVVFGVFSSPEFQRGVVAGAMAAGAGLLARRLKPGWTPDWGLLWFAAVVVAGASAKLLDRTATEQAFTQRSWVLPLAAAAFAAVFYGLQRHRRRSDTSLAFLLSVGGVWATVPDTEHALLLLGATAPLVLVWWPRAWVTIGIGGAVVVGASVIWGAGLGSYGRDGAYVGAFGALASLALLDVPVRLKRFNLGFHFVTVFAWSRIAGLSRSSTTALVLGAVLTLAILLVKRWLAPRL